MAEQTTQTKRSHSLLSRIVSKTADVSRHTTRRDIAHLWVYLLMGFVVVLAGVVAWSAYLFWGINADRLFSTLEESGERVETISREELTETLTFFDERARRFSELETTAPETVDPAR